MNGAEVFLEILRSAGVRYIFGLPGTTEAALLDALTGREDIQYVLTLHESIAVGMADGFARATGSPGVVSVHTTVGTANALGMVINAFNDQVPLVVTAGLKDQRALGTGVFCDSPFQVTDLLRQYTKWSWQVLDPACLGRDLAKAFRISRNPVPGPVFVGIPENFWLAPSTADPELIVGIARPYRGDSASIEEAVKMLQTAARPIMIIGNEVGGTGALDEGVAFAEKWQLPVFTEERSSWAYLNFPTNHPLYAGSFNRNSPLVKKADVVLSVGARMFMPMGHRTERYFSPGTRIIQIHSDPGRIATHVPVTLGIASNARLALQDLLAASKNVRIGREGREEQMEEIATFKRTGAQAREELLEAAQVSERVRVQHLISELSRLAAPDAVVVNEGIRSGYYLQDYFNFTRERSYFGYTGGCLGWGLGAALGIKLAFSGREVIAFLGDGSFLFSPQALWTAAHYGIGVKVVICNNMAYMAVKSALCQCNEQAAARGRFLGVDLTDPEIDYLSLCRGFGVPADRVTSPSGLTEGVRQLLSHEGPAVLEVVVDQGDMEKRPD